MAQLLSPLIRQGWVKKYLDDVILFTPNFDTLLSSLNTFFQHLSQGGVQGRINNGAWGARAGPIVQGGP